MKIGVVLLCFIITFSGCNSDSIVEQGEGVSLKLAQHRKKEINDVKYNLFFSIPELKTQAIKAKAEIEFTLQSKQNVSLDFTAGSGAISSVSINDVASYVISNEHITLAASHTKKGVNKVVIEFTAPSQSLNRSDEYLYTLLVPDRARTLFPCFDQPDMKALYTLTLQVPQGWKAVSNSKVSEVRDNTIHFAQTEPLSTYLFSFVAGRLEQVSDTRQGRTISLYHRETDSLKVAQIGDIMGEVFTSLDWLEDYTDVKYPFSKYDLIILPGFQYGGMEHTGATLYADRVMFLSANPTENERLTRCKLIAHETAHMWFGDYVTMKWFNDVWTKEVFANYFGSLIVEPQFPEVNHDLNFLMSYAPSAYSEERTEGTNPIQQDLDNLQDAGLVYGNIIYTKSPIVMNMLVEMIGKEQFQKGIREYLHTYAYGNATWDDLITILDNLTPIDLKMWSHTWVKEKGMPTIVSELKDNCLDIKQVDKYNRAIVWLQKYAILADDKIINVDLSSKEIGVEVPKDTKYIIPNIDGRSYGFFQLDMATFKYILENIATFESEVTRGSLLITLYENVMNNRSLAADFVSGISNYISTEGNELLFSLAVSYGKSCHFLLRDDAPEKLQFEQQLNSIYTLSSNSSFRTIALRAYYQIAESPAAVANCYNIWDKAEKLSERDAIRISYELAIRMPEKSDEIIAKQLSRLTNADRVREYKFVSPSVSADGNVRDSVFDALLLADNREIEPYAEAALSYLNHPLRARGATKYILRGLEAVQDVKRTGDIFFPKAWAGALLWGHRSQEASDIVTGFFGEHLDYPVMLGNKIRQQTFFLTPSGVAVGHF